MLKSLQLWFFVILYLCTVYVWNVCTFLFHVCCVGVIFSNHIFYSGPLLPVNQNMNAIFVYRNTPEFERVCVLCINTFTFFLFSHSYVFLFKAGIIIPSTLILSYPRIKCKYYKVQICCLLLTDLIWHFRRIVILNNGQQFHFICQLSIFFKYLVSVNFSSTYFCKFNKQ